MAGYRLHVTHAGTTTVDDLEHLDELNARIALERLTHELNPVVPGGYVVDFDVVTFDVVAHAAVTVAGGHFYVRVATDVTAPVETGNRSS